MANIYYRRWTRMFVGPAAKYLKQYDVLPEGAQAMMHMANMQNPQAENKWSHTLKKHDPQGQLNEKLIRNLFLKYPDLKYESISRQKYQGDNFNSYSYSYSFITEQKKLMKQGYTINKAFEIVEAKFQEKFKRKMDQTLISRGLAIGNRAKSLLTFYQQQVQQQSRLKMLRTKRQVLKYQEHLQQIEQAVNRNPSQKENNQQTHYERIFQKITEQSSEKLNEPYAGEKRSEMISRLENQFKNTFTQFYQIASYKDRLKGLTDQEIKQNITVSPTKIKKLARQLVNYLKSRGNVSIDINGELKISDSINENLRSFISSSSTIKIAILNHLIGYENPITQQRMKNQKQAKIKLSMINSAKPSQLNDEVKSAIKDNKIKELKRVVEKDVPADKRTYRLLQSAQERMLRLQIKYLSSFIKNQKQPSEDIFKRLQTCVNEFRRLKFRMQKRHKATLEGELMFPEHYAFGKHPSAVEETEVEYEDLLEYLRKKSEERRLKAIDQVDDNKINQLIKKQAANEIPRSEETREPTKN